MNKKGFTLIEVIVSVVLVSIVMVTLTATLVELKKKSEDVSKNTDAVIYSSIASRVMNADIADHNGIKFIECDPNGEECGIVLGNNDKRSLTLKETSDTSAVSVEYVDSTGNYILKKGSNYVGKVNVEINNGGDISSCTSIPANCLSISVDGSTCVCYKELITTTLLYKDISEETTTGLFNSNTTSGKVKYIKTLEYTRTTDPDTKNISTEGYGFSRLYYNQSPFESLSDGSNILTRLMIGIYDGIDKNDETYNVSLYSASRADSSNPSVGDKFFIRLNTIGNSVSPHGIVQPQVESIHHAGLFFPLTQITEKFNMGFEAVNPGVKINGEENVGIGETQTFYGFAVDTPKYCEAATCEKQFQGFYTEVGSEGACSGTMVINSAGQFTVAPNYFLRNTEIFACWL